MNLFRKNNNQPIKERRRPVSENKPAVFSYYAHSADSSTQGSGRGEEKKGQNAHNYHVKLARIPLYLAFIVIVVALFYSVLLDPSPRVVVLNIPGTINRDSRVYQESVQTIWKQSLLNRIKLTVSTDKISRQIQDEFNELGNVSIQLPLLGHRPTVVLSPASPVLHLIGSNGAFYVAQDGKVMAPVTDVSQNRLNDLPLVRDESNLTVEPGNGILSAPETDFLRKLYKYLKAANLDVQSITLPRNAAGQADVRLVGEGYFVKFSMQNDPRQAVGSYLAIKASMQAENITPKHYIDARVEEKIFYL